jgi:predicted transcriptional regulator YdeE
MGSASETRLDVEHGPANSKNNEALKPPDIVRREAFLVMGTVTRRKPETDRPETFSSIWNDFETHHQTIKRHSVDAKYYGVSFAAGPDGSFDYMAGMAVRPDAETSDGLEVRPVPSATYAVFACSIQSIGQTYRHIFGEWRAGSGCEPDTTKPAFEEYPLGIQTNAPVLIHIPICVDPAK